MTEQEIKDKAKDVYIRCFDDDINYPCVLEALEIAIRESTEEKIADIKANCDLAIEGRDIKIKELEKENAELKMKIYGGGYEMIITKKDADIILLEKENAELKEKLALRKYAD